MILETIAEYASELLWTCLKRYGCVAGRHDHARKQGSGGAELTVNTTERTHLK